jgi:hypothetical protein
VNIEAGNVGRPIRSRSTGGAGGALDARAGSWWSLRVRRRPHLGLARCAGETGRHHAVRQEPAGAPNDARDPVPGQRPSVGMGREFRGVGGGARRLPRADRVLECR